MTADILRTFDVNEIITIARNAGAEIMAMRPDVIGNPDIKGDGSPVTIADKRASAIVVEGLNDVTPHIPVISEENDEAENFMVLQSSKTYWIVDPLDGTRTYIDGHDGFGVHIGLISDGEPIAGIVYFPAQDVLYFTHGGEAFRQEGQEAPQRIRVSSPSGLREPFVVATAWSKNRQPKNGVEVVTAVGGARACVTADGTSDVALFEGRFSYWDIAAAHAVLRAAGGDLFDLQTGKPIHYPSDRLYTNPAVGGHPGVVSKVIAHLRSEVSTMDLRRKKFEKRL